MKYKFITFLMLILGMTAFAQTNDLTDEEIDAFKVQCQERIDAFQMGLEIIGDKRQPADIKTHYLRSLPEMFMGSGDPWTDVSGGRHGAVKMQVSSLSSGKVHDVPLKTYLTRLRDLNYKSVEIKKAQTCMISNLYKVSENMYMGTCTFFQFFTGIGSDNRVYKDRTQKDVDVYIQRVEDGSLGTYWDMKFGDINVVQTSPY